MTQARYRAAVLGKPIAHSLSPVLHNAAYKALGLSEWFYDRHEVSDDELVAFVDSLVGDRATYSENESGEQWRGLSLTMPLKKRILTLGTTRDKWSQYLQVSNTAIFRRDEAKAVRPVAIDLYNTDAFGIEAGLNDGAESSSITLRRVDGPCLVIGSGSTAESAIAALSELGATEITVAARHFEKARPLKAIARDLGISARLILLEEVPDFISDMSSGGPGLRAVVSTIPAHAADGIAHGIAQMEGTPLRGVRLLDVVYDPRPSDLLVEAARKGADAIGGERMLLWQAVAQVALMVGIERDEVPVQAMRAALNEVVGKGTDDEHTR
ncbi:MAG: shikimate dehydrogenase [Bifidobacteriaceae bacterium]|nr:shikimate dehydrogenase [Bifidobacteriaceae bacterium]MCI1915102.1 shikimate dehydrogenase [Bifidobacteriaceae bacterium]